MQSNLKQIIIIICILPSAVWFSVQGILGFSHNTTFYRAYILTFTIIGLIFCFWDLAQNKLRKGKTFWVFGVFIPVLIFAEGLLETGIYQIPASFMQKHVPIAIVSILSGIYMALYVAKNGILQLSKWMDIIMLIITLAVAKSTISVFGSKDYVGIGAASYQIMSYLCAFAFLITLCFILYGDQMERFRLFRSALYKKLSYMLLVVQLVACVSSGGRGGMILLILGSLWLFYVSGKITKMFVALFVVASLVLLMLNMFQNSAIVERLQYGYNRVFSYIGDDGFNTKATSGRDALYERALIHASEHNYMGDGLINADVPFGGYPHNLEMELLIQGGILYLLFFIVLAVYLYRYANTLVRQHHEFILMPLTAFPIINLQFSGTYLQNCLFWFCIVYILARKEELTN